MNLNVSRLASYCAPSAGWPGAAGHSASACRSAGVHCRCAGLWCAFSGVPASASRGSCAAAPVGLLGGGFRRDQAFRGILHGCDWQHRLVEAERAPATRFWPKRRASNQFFHGLRSIDALRAATAAPAPPDARGLLREVGGRLGNGQAGGGDRWPAPHSYQSGLLASWWCGMAEISSL